MHCDVSITATSAALSGRSADWSPVGSKNEEVGFWVCFARRREPLTTFTGDGASRVPSLSALGVTARGHPSQQLDYDAP